MDEVMRAKLEQALNLLEEVLVLDDVEVTPVPEPSPPPPPDPDPAPVAAASRKIAWGKQVTPEFKASVLWIEQRIKLDPNKLMACMKFESDLNPRARNPQSSATGLIQFMDATVASMLDHWARQGIKLSGAPNRRARDLMHLTAQQQLSWVYHYFRPFGDDLSNWSIEDVYMAILLPSMIGKPLDAPMRWSESAYRVNSGLDLNKDKTITKREAAHHVKRLYDLGMTEEFMG